MCDDYDGVSIERPYKLMKRCHSQIKSIADMKLPPVHCTSLYLFNQSLLDIYLLLLFYYYYWRFKKKHQFQQKPLDKCMADWQLCVDLRINSIFYELTLFLRRNYGLYKTIFVRVRCFQFNALLLLRGPFELSSIPRQ